MRKIVNILVMVIAMVAIVIVAMFGVSEAGNENFYIDSLTITNMSGNALDSNSVIQEGWPDKKIRLTFDKQGEDDEGNPVMAYLFNVSILPEIAQGNAVRWDMAGDEGMFSVPEAGTGRLIVTETESHPDYGWCILSCKANDGGTSAGNHDSVFILVGFSSTEGGESSSSEA
ncbi:MAG: hypothetical protein LKG11_04820 [Bacilli bacterium]|jgi:hypothetical protein|nr:hypothetical protein [Bacilli bacterium]